jgi:hypothetical protein
VLEGEHKEGLQGKVAKPKGKRNLSAMRCCYIPSMKGDKLPLLAVH